MDLKGITVLICDDSMLIRKKLKELLEAEECLVIEAQNGVDCVEAYRTARPSIVFMDIVMPQADGLNALKQIRQIDGSAKVIMLSSIGTAAKLVEALKNGAIDFIQKPYEKDQIISAITKALQRKE